MQTFDNDLTVQNIAGYTVYDRMKFEDLQKVFVEKGVSRIKRMRSVLVRMFGFVFWKEITLEETLEKCLINVKRELKSEQEVLELC